MQSWRLGPSVGLPAWLFRFTTRQRAALPPSSATVYGDRIDYYAWLQYQREIVRCDAVVYHGNRLYGDGPFYCHRFTVDEDVQDQPFPTGAYAETRVLPIGFATYLACDDPGYWRVTRDAEPPAA